MAKWSEYIPAIELAGKVSYALLGFLVVLAVFMVQAKEQHADFAEADIEVKKQLADHGAYTERLSSDLRALTVEVRAEQRVAGERRDTAQRDRDQIKQQLNILLERAQ